MTPLKVGVVGVGALGKHHARLYAASPNADLVGVSDVDGDRAAEIANEYGARVFRDPAELAAVADALSVAVPTTNHHRVVSELLDTGTHVLVEKPLAATIEEGRELVALADRQALALHVGHVERFNPVITYLEEQLDEPRFIEAHRLAPYPPPRPGQLPRGVEVGVVLDLMIHDIDVVLMLVKDDVDRVEAVGVPVLSPSEDIANARITFKGGCVANLTASRVSPELMRKIRVFQSNAYLSLDYQERQGKMYRKTATGIAADDVPIADHNALQWELEEFIRCVRARLDGADPGESKTAARHGLRALEIAVEVTRLING